MNEPRADRVAIQGELGSNSHLAARAMAGTAVHIVPFRLSAEVLAAVRDGSVDAAVLPIENSLHGSVAEHYDLLLSHPLRIDGESQMRIEHHLIALPGTPLHQIREILSHPVALSQCRQFLAAMPRATAQTFYDTAGSVRHILEQKRQGVAGIAPRLATEIYGGEIVAENIEDHRENFTRFHLLRRRDAPQAQPGTSNKLSAAFALEHRPGSLVEALTGLAASGANLTKIESRPVPGKPWEYVFFVDLQFSDGDHGAASALQSLAATASMVRELGRYRAAGT